MAVLQWGKGREGGSETQVLPPAQEEMGMGTHMVDDTWATCLWSSGQDSRPSLTSVEGPGTPTPQSGIPCSYPAAGPSPSPPRGSSGPGVGLTLSTNVLSFSGISRGMVVRTSMMADRGMLTLGLEAWEARRRAVRQWPQGLLKSSLTSPALRGQSRPSLGCQAALRWRCPNPHFTGG